MACFSQHPDNVHRLSDMKEATIRRAAGALLVQASWLEPGAPEAETAGRLAANLRAMADWLELDEIVVRPVGTLATALASA